jgi:hypothetical protein
MSNDLTLDDLAGGAGEAADAADQATNAAEQAADSGESLMELIEFVDDRGYLEPLLFGTDALSGDTQTDATMNTDTDTDTDVELSAKNIAALSERIINQVGDVPLSKVAQFAEQNPDKVNGIIADIPNERDHDPEQ